MSLFTVQEPLLIEKKCRFELVSSENSVAVVNIIYPDIREKSIRLQSVSLRKDQKNEWKIAEFFGEVVGHDSENK